MLKLPHAESNGLTRAEIIENMRAIVDEQHALLAGGIALAVNLFWDGPNG